MSSKKRTYNCGVCGKCFETYNIGQLTCSKICYGKVRSAHALVQVKCQTCNEFFKISKGRISMGRGKFCSKSCSWNRPKKYDTQEFLNLWTKGYSVHKISTLVTASEETVRKWAIKKGVFEKRHATGKKCSNWNGGIKSYRKKVFEIKERKCEICGYNKVPQIIEVHHLDKNRKNNSHKNLLAVCPTCHKAIHRGYIHP